jgi:hypothetical protein
MARKAIRVVTFLVALAGCGAPGARPGDVDDSVRMSASEAALVGSPADSVIRTLIVDEDTIHLAASVTFRTIAARWGGQAPEKTDDSDPTLEASALCYRIAEQGHEMFLILRADPHMGHPTVLGFTLSDERPENWSIAECPTRATRLARVRTAQGLRIGLPIDSALTMLAASGRDSAPLYLFHFDAEATTESAHATENVPAGTPYSIGASTEIRQRDGRVSAITAWYVEAL